MSNINSLQTKIYHYIANNQELAKLVNRPLWFTGETDNYAHKVADNNEVSALYTYGNIHNISSCCNLTDSYTIYASLANEKQSVSAVCNAYEYYFTNMVFIEKKYKLALLDLYFLKAEHYDQEAIEQAINDTYNIAEKNGVKIDQDELIATFSRILAKQINIVEEELNELTKQAFPQQVRNIANATKDYYLNPSVDNYQKLKNSFDTLANLFDRDIVSKDTNKSGLYCPFLFNK